MDSETAGDIKRHFNVVAEGLRADIRLVIEVAAANTDRLERVETRLDRVEVRLDVLEEIDGPMLEHGLQGFHGSRLWLPTRESLKPDRRFLERYTLFRQT